MIKKEIDLSIFTSDFSKKYVIELKFPRSGQYPEQMFKACQDIFFIEQLTLYNFNGGIFVMAVDNRLFYSGNYKEGIYSFFRDSQLLHGDINQPTRAGNAAVALNGSYCIEWIKCADNLKYTLIKING